MVNFFIEHGNGIVDAVAKILAIIAVYVAYRGLGVAYSQYKHSVRIAERNERRAGVELAARECTHYGTTLMTQLSKLRTEIEDSGCDYFKHFKHGYEVVGREQRITPNDKDVTPEDLQKLAAHGEKIRLALNALEGFAIPFYADVADDDIGFVICSHSFVDLFERNFPLYSRSDLKRFYPATQAVYFRWKARIAREELLRQHSAAATHLCELSEKVVLEKSDSWSARAVAEFFRRMADIISKKRG